jgi:putative sigma-54 modulation protein
MRLELTGRHVDITPVLRRLVDRKLARLERMLNDRAVSAQVVLSEIKNGCRADVTLHARGEKFLHAAGVAVNWETAMTQAVDKLVQQAQKVKGKWEERRRRGVKASLTPAALVEAAPAARPAAAVRARMPRIFRASRQTITQMSIADAARRIEGNGGGVVVFRNAETASISVLYRGENGELTLVETEA